MKKLLMITVLLGSAAGNVHAAAEPEQIMLKKINNRSRNTIIFSVIMPDALRILEQYPAQRVRGRARPQRADAFFENFYPYRLQQLATGSHHFLEAPVYNSASGESVVFWVIQEGQSPITVKHDGASWVFENPFTRDTVGTQDDQLSAGINYRNINVTADGIEITQAERSAPPAYTPSVPRRTMPPARARVVRVRGAQPVAPAPTPTPTTPVEEEGRDPSELSFAERMKRFQQ